MLVAIFPSSSSPCSSRLMLARFLDGLATREATACLLRGTTACLLRGTTWLSFLVTRQCLIGRSKAGSKHSTDHCLDGLTVPTRTGHGSSNKLQLRGAAVIQETNHTGCADRRLLVFGIAASCSRCISFICPVKVEGTVSAAG